MTHAYDPDAATSELDPARLDVGAVTTIRPGDDQFDSFIDDPFDDDLAKELAARAPRPKATRTTLVLGGLALVVGGFLGGVLVQQNFGTAPASTGGRGNLPAGALASAFPGGFGGGGQGNGGATAAPGGTATTGTVTLVDGTTLYITTAAGEVITVKTTGTTTISTEQKAALKDLKVGATVTVQGTANAEGIITATGVTKK